MQRYQDVDKRQAGDDSNTRAGQQARLQRACYTVAHCTLTGPTYYEHTCIIIPSLNIRHTLLSSVAFWFVCSLCTIHTVIA